MSGLPLYTTVEQALDEGDIVIVPIPTEDGPTRWRCLLVNQDKRDLTCWTRSSGKSRPDKHTWAEYDGQELQFLSDNRPARRFLYFRFIITYLNARRMKNFDFSTSVEARKIFWASPGEYLRKSTLITLARMISDFELPPSVYGMTTFEDNSMPQDDEDDANLLFSMDLSDILEKGKRESDSGEAEADSEVEMDEA